MLKISTNLCLAVVVLCEVRFTRLSDDHDEYNDDFASTSKIEIRSWFWFPSTLPFAGSRLTRFPVSPESLPDWYFRSFLNPSPRTPIANHFRYLVNISSKWCRIGISSLRSTMILNSAGDQSPAWLLARRTTLEQTIPAEAMEEK